MASCASFAVTSSLLLSLFVGQLWLIAAEEEHPPEALRHPGGPRCYYDALALGCPTSISSDGHKFLCTCDYRDNNWFHVLGHFNSIFSVGEGERSSMATRLKARPEAGGTLSLDVGLPERLQCGAQLAVVYPATKAVVDIPELYSLLGSFIWPEVRQTLMNICVPGRIALQLICQHALLHGLKDFEGAKAYADKAWELWEMVDKCVDHQTPWPFPGLGGFLQHWRAAGEGLPEVSTMAWYPDPALMRAKYPEESEQHYWPCVPLQDPVCFPAGSDSDYTSCSSCCDPGAGPHGNGACFVGEWTFARCCRTPPESGGRFF